MYLSVHSSALVEYSEDVTCHVYSTLHSDVSWEETAEVTKFGMLNVHILINDKGQELRI